MASKWLLLVRELNQLPEMKITRETVDIVLKVLHHYNGFYHCSMTDDDPESWAKFVEIMDVSSCLYDCMTV